MANLSTDSLAAVFVFAFVVTFGAVVSPGPVTAAILSESPRQGWRVGPMVASGHSILEFLMVVLITFGLATLMNAPLAGTIIGLLGGLTLLAIGGAYIYAAARGTIRLPHPQEASQPSSYPALFGLGVATTLANPFWYVWWVTVAAGYLAQAQAISIATLAAFYLGHISADFTWDTFLSASASAGRRILTDRRYRALIIVTGGFMIYFGIVFFVGALEK
ncbi:MAG: LysE family transporter [Anaerolineae bacterium]|nr:MAG: LysE family transporter [Anaerolineae bacterium]